MALTGDPLFSFNQTGGVADVIQPDTSLADSLELAPRFIEDLLGPAVFWGGGGGIPGDPLRGLRAHALAGRAGRAVARSVPRLRCGSAYALPAIPAAHCRNARAVLRDRRGGLGGAGAGSAPPACVGRAGGGACRSCLWAWRRPRSGTSATNAGGPPSGANSSARSVTWCDRRTGPGAMPAVGVVLVPDRALVPALMRWLDKPATAFAFTPRAGTPPRAAGHGVASVRPKLRRQLAWPPHSALAAHAP